MRHNRAKLMALVILSMGLTRLIAQQSLSTSGSNASGSGGSVSYSVGQVVYTTNTGSNGSVAQGVQQTFEISIISGVEEAKGITLNCLVYPNPVTDFLKLKIENFSIDKLTFEIYDIQGKLLKTKKIENNEVSIEMSNLLQGAYFLRVLEEGQEIKTFKIIKN